MVSIRDLPSAWKDVCLLLMKSGTYFQKIHRHGGVFPHAFQPIRKNHGSEIIPRLFQTQRRFRCCCLRWALDYCSIVCSFGLFGVNHETGPTALSIWKFEALPQKLDPRNGSPESKHQMKSDAYNLLLLVVSGEVYLSLVCMSGNMLSQISGG